VNDLDQAKSRDLTGLNASGLLPVGVATFAAGSLYAWSALVPALMERFGVGHTEAGKTFSLAIVAFTASVLVIPQLSRRYRCALATSAYALAAGASIVAAAMAPNFALVLTAFSFGFGFCSGAIYIASLDLASAAPRPAIAVPLMVAAFGVGGAIISALLPRLGLPEAGFSQLFRDDGLAAPSG
jgi:MFS transporter, OFA family, oxalate/formate antiporter